MDRSLAVQNAKLTEVQSPKGRSAQEVVGLVEFLGLVLDNVYSGIIVCDPDCRIIFMNKVYSELLKADRDEAVGKHIQGRYFPNSRLSEPCRRERLSLAKGAH